MTTGAHFGDPCIYCHTPHDDVPTGQCKGHGVLISRDRAEALLEYAKTGRGPSGWPTTLWAEVQRFIEGIEAQLLSPKTDSLPSPIAWRYRWKIEGEWTNWRVAEASQASRHLPSLEEHPLYAPPVPAQDDDKLRIAVEEALADVEYVPGDHPIVPVKHDRFVKAIRHALKSTAAQEGGSK